jgi:nicotinate phosphoribosyltransferase
VVGRMAGKAGRMTDARHHTHAEGPVSLALLTDVYQLTMAYGYWRSGRAETEAAFHMSFRSCPFDGGFAIACGLEPVVAYLRSMRFTAEDTAWLAAQRGNDGAPLLGDDFLGWLEGFRFTCDVDAVPEGTVVFPREPLLRVAGPIVQAQLVETTILNLVNFQTLIATKAARCVFAAQGRPVVEFGLRRAQGPDGGLSASRAAYVGGCEGTSNALAGRLFGIPAKGTHAHSWVMAFPSEPEAFEAYAEALPNNCTFLVDTYDTLEGVRHAVEAGRRLRERGHEMIGIRIDSGDLAWLAKQARKILDEAGFPDARITASNELDEHVIASLLEQGAPIDVWGVGTRLATGWDEPALGGVYKLSAVREPGGEWQPRLKVTEQAAKISTPGLQGVRRYSAGGFFSGDMVYEVSRPPAGGVTMVDPLDATRCKSFPSDEPFVELLEPVFRGGECVYEPPPLSDVRARALAQLEHLDPAIRRFLNPHHYPVGLERGLHDLRQGLILEARGHAGERSSG